MATQCIGSNHAAGIQGHDSTAAAEWHVGMQCGSCGWSLEVELCAARVRFIRRGEYTMTCPQCGQTVPWREMWSTVEPLIDIPRIGREVAVQAVTAADSRDLVAEFRSYLESRRRAAGTIRLRVRHIEWLSREYPVLAAVTPEQLDAWTRAQSQGRKPATINSIIKSIRVFYAWADRFGVVRPNPTVLLDLLPDPHRISRTVDDDALQVVLRTADDRLRAMLLLGRLAGLRLSEIATLPTSARRDDWLTIIGKGDKQRRLFIVPELAAALDALEPAGGYYFPGGTDGHLHPQSVNKIIRKGAGVNPHALRHAAATNAYRATHDLRATQAFLGHANPNTTGIYVHVDDDALQMVASAGADRGDWS